MRRLTKLFHCGDSQALEMFVGLYLVAAGVHRVLQLRDEFLGFMVVPFTGFVILAGLLQAIAAGHGNLTLRHWACGTSFFSIIFLTTAHEGVLVGAACAWAWYRTLLDDKLERTR